MADKKFSFKIKCEHCLNTAPMEIVAKFFRVIDKVEYHKNDYEDVHKIYRILQCPACYDVQLQTYVWCDAYMEIPDDTTFEILYPNKQINDLPLGLPDNINKALRQHKK